MIKIFYENRECLKFKGGLSISQNYRVNEKIRSPKVLLINEEGKNLGVIPIAEALKIREETSLDLVEVSPDKEPPVCKLLDYGKLKYQQKKKVHQKRKSQLHQKEIRVTPKIGEHDFQFKLKQVRQFIENGNKVLVSMNFRGREMAHVPRAKELLERMHEETGEIAKIEKDPKMEGRRMTMILVPNKN